MTSIKHLIALFHIATTATPDELAAHIRANRDLNPANVINIYALNEHDEGGWLHPTRGADGKPDEVRIRAREKILCPSLSKER